MSISDVEIDRGSIQGVISNMAEIEGKVSSALMLITETVAMKMEEWAKENAVWTDRTGNARQFLKGRAFWEDSKTLVLSMSHTMEYGVWLELAHERKYAILEQSIEQYKDELLKGWKKIVGD